MQRLRRLRLNANLREMLLENSVQKRDLIYPLFVVEGEKIRREISSMPGVFNLSIDELLAECEEVVRLGIKSVILFGIPTLKDSVGSDALNSEGLIARAVRAVKARFGESLLVVTDLCFCEYTDHGHCGILDACSVDNDATLEISAMQALIHAKAGADVIAPSGMMDGIVERLRETLDANGFENLPIMSYSTKFASGYYGPFREAADSTPAFGDRRSYQMPTPNLREALRESLEDEAQGADILMVKPALAYLDVVREIRTHSNLPLCVYNVSGEYSLLKAGEKLGLIDYERVLTETMLSFKRAGADLIITYHAKEVCKLIDEGRL